MENMLATMPSAFFVSPSVINNENWEGHPMGEPEREGASVGEAIGSVQNSIQELFNTSPQQRISLAVGACPAAFIHA
jgi:hypothetical protein